MKSLNLSNVVVGILLAGLTIHVQQLRHQVLQPSANYIYLAKHEHALPPKASSTAPMKIRVDNYPADFQGIVKYTSIIQEKRHFIPFCWQYVQTKLLASPLLTILQNIFFKDLTGIFWHQPDTVRTNLGFTAAPYQQAVTHGVNAVSQIAQSLNTTEVLVTEVLIMKKGFYSVLRINAKIK